MPALQPARVPASTDLAIYRGPMSEKDGPMSEKDGKALLDAVMAELERFRFYRPHDADDVIQDAVLDLLRKYRPENPVESLVLQARSVAQGHLANYYRKRTRRTKLGRSTSDFSGAAAKPDDGADARHDATVALTPLSKAQRVVVLGVWGNGETEAGVAGRLGCTRHQVRRMLEEARPLMLKAVGG